MKLPVEFTSHISATGAFEEPWSMTSGETQARCSIPKEFGGAGGGFSPEDLFLQAAINCFVGTFKVMAKMSKIEFSDLNVTGQLSVDKASDGKVVMKYVNLDITVLGAARPDRVPALVAKVIKDGFILNSIKSELSYNLNLQT